MDKMQIKEQRNELVVQSNEIIRNVRPFLNDLSVAEVKLVIYLISKLCAEDKDFKRVKFNISEYCDVCGIKKSGREYERIKQAIKNVRDKSYWIKNDDEEILFTWIDTAKLKKYETVELVLSEALKPYLLELSKSFTKFELINVLCLRSKYSIRLYQILKSYLWLGKWEVETDRFREIMYLGDKYPQYKELQRNVISNSLREINKYTDLEVKFSTKKQGRSIGKLRFDITEKRGYQMTWELILNQEERLSIKESFND